MSLLRAVLEQTPWLAELELEKLLQCWTREKKLKRRQCLIQQGEVEHWLYFVTKGCMRIYILEKEKESCVGFAYEGTFICSFPSFVEELPSEYYIEALQDTEVVGISRSDFYQLLDEHKGIAVFWRKALEAALLGRIQRETEFMTLNPAERFALFVKRSAHLFQKVPQKYIAAYLGISPETLSRLKAKKS